MYTIGWFLLENFHFLLHLIVQRDGDNKILSEPQIFISQIIQLSVDDNRTNDQNNGCDKLKHHQTVPESPTLFTTLMFPLQFHCRSER